jgi:hypothetical protein
MIQVLVGNSTERQTVIIEPTQKLKKTLDDQRIDYSTSQIYLDGSTLKPGDLDKTFADFSISEKCMLIAVVKQNNS